MRVADSLGVMLQGVSQQPNRVRPEGKVTEQVNYISDVNLGLTPRPPTQYVNQLGTYVGYWTYFDFILEDTFYLAATKPDEIKVWDINGVEFNVLFENNASAYLNHNMSTYAFGDELFVTNRNIRVKKVSTTDTSPVLSNVGLIVSYGSSFDRNHRATITYSDGIVVTAEWKSPNQNTFDELEQTHAENVATQLRLLLEADLNLKAGTTISQVAGTLYIRHTGNETFTLTSDDDWQNENLLSYTTYAESIDDLPEYAPHGYLIRITGEDEGTKDDYLLRFDSDTTNNVGSGFGRSGVWREYYDPTEVTQLDRTTMPHILVREGDNFVLRQGAWEGRRVGDEESNPMPDFVGNRIRDIAGLQSRLVFCGDSVVTMSRSKEPYDFFRETTQAELDTDPIGMSSTQEKSVRLDWIVGFDKNLVLISAPGEGQYVISGTNKITPENASLIVSTDYEVSFRGKPVSSGKTVIMPFQNGEFSGVNEFFTNDSITTQAVESITDDTSKYITGVIQHIACDKNRGYAAFVTDDPDNRDIVWHYKYLWKNSEKVQSAWSKWQFNYVVEYMFFQEGRMYVVGTISGDQFLSYIELDLSADVGQDYATCLDSRVTYPSTSTSIVHPEAGITVIQGEGCPHPGNTVEIEANGLDATGFLYNVIGDYGNGVMYGGVPYERLLKPSMPMIRRSAQVVDPSRYLMVDQFLVYFENASSFSYDFENKFQDTFSEDIELFPLDENPASAGAITDAYSIPWGERSDWSDLTVRTSSHHPFGITDITYTGYAYRKELGQ